MLFPESFLDGMQLTLDGKPFDRCDIPAVRLHSQYSAGFDRLTIQKHRTGTADTGFASDMSAGKTDIIPEKMDKQHSRLYFSALRFTIDC
jgi:hypothetical protein